MSFIDGFVWGMDVVDIGVFISVFVGIGILGCIFNVFGEFVDNKGFVFVGEIFFIYCFVFKLVDLEIKF